MSRNKKIVLTILAIIVVVASIGVAVWIFHGKSDEIASNNTEINVNVATGNNTSASRTSSTTSSSLNNNQSDNTIDYSDTANGNGDVTFSLVDDVQAQEVMQNFCWNLFDVNRVESAYAMIADQVPDQFNVASNAILRFTPDRGLPGFQKYEKFAAPNIISNTFVISDGHYARYVMLVSAKSLGGHGQDGTIFEAGREVLHQMDAVYDGSSGKIVYLHINTINPISVSMIESQYDTIVNALNNPANEEQFVKASVLAMYSYSPFIDAKYWTTVDRITAYPQATSLVYDSNIVCSLLKGWRLSNDGRCYRVGSLSTPTAVSSANGYKHYSCDIVYYSDSRKMENGDDKETKATVHIYIDSATQKIIGLEESNVVVDNASDRIYLDSDLAYNPTIEMLLG